MNAQALRTVTERAPKEALDHPSRVLRWALEHVPRLMVSTSLGPQTLVIVDVLHHLGADIPIHLLDTGLLFDETLWLKQQVEDRYGITIRVETPELTVDEQSRVHGPELWQRNPDKCCSIRKVRPLARTMRDYDGWITGLRRDQSQSRAHIQPIEWDTIHERVKINPLHNWSRSQVFRYLKAHGLPYNPLLDQGFRSVGCAPCTSAVTDGDPDDERAGRWAGRAKSECGIHFLFPTLSEDPS